MKNKASRNPDLHEIGLSPMITNAKSIIPTIDQDFRDRATDFDGTSQFLGKTNIVKVSLDNQYPESVKPFKSKADLLGQHLEEEKQEESESMLLSPGRQEQDQMQTIVDRDEKLPQTTTEI